MTVNWNQQAVIERVRQAAFRGVIAGAERVRELAVASIMSGEKTGRLYYRQGISKMSKSGKSFSGGHRASAPGEAPASDTGRLAGSIRVVPDFASVSAKVTASTAYAPFLEYGTSRMEPRPFMRPALKEAQDFIEGRVWAEVFVATGQR